MLRPYRSGAPLRFLRIALSPLSRRAYGMFSNTTGVTVHLTKTVLTLALVVGITATAVAFTQFVELSAPALFLLMLGLGFGVFVTWDRVLFRDVDTVREIVEDQNLALAVFYLVPALLVLGASLAL